jgi:pimeloyl-ACP methyl ester carboxylesterase
MSKFKQMILVSSAILIALNTVACGAISPAATPTLENTPLPTVTPTLENTPLPTVTPTLLPYIPTMKGAVEIAGDHGGYKLIYQCFGEGTPTVIVEAAAGDTPVTSLTWKAVTQRIQSTTRICIYNRVAGVRTSQDIAENLHFLLSEIHVPGPYILVAHSLGGWHARVFAHLYPEDVAGMILVDTTPTYPDSAIALATAYPTYSPDEAAGITQNRFSEADLSTTILPPSMDGLDMQTSNDQVRQAGKFGDLPLIVISQNVGPEDFPGRDPVTQKELASVVLKVAEDLTNLSSKSVFMVAHTSNHFISMDEPQIIIDAITQMVEEIRKH